MRFAQILVGVALAVLTHASHDVVSLGGGDALGTVSPESVDEVPPQLP